MYLFYNFK